MVHGRCVPNGVPGKPGDIPEYVDLRGTGSSASVDLIFLPHSWDQNGHESNGN